MRVRSNGRVDRTPSEWREIISRFEQSGLSIIAFCQRESLTESSFRRWRAKLAPQMESFVELGIPAVGTERSAWTMELEFPGNVVLRVRG